MLPLPFRVVTSSRMLPPAPPVQLVAEPSAVMLPSSCTVVALMRITPPPGFCVAFVSPLELPAPEPPGSFGSHRDPYTAAGTPPVFSRMPPAPPWLPPDAYVLPPTSVFG
jgi:hypothetical protein